MPVLCVKQPISEGSKTTQNAAKVAIWKSKFTKKSSEEGHSFLLCYTVYTLTTAKKPVDRAAANE